MRAKSHEGFPDAEVVSTNSAIDVKSASGKDIRLMPAGTTAATFASGGATTLAGTLSVSGATARGRLFSVQKNIHARFHIRSSFKGGFIEVYVRWFHTVAHMLWVSYSPDCDGRDRCFTVDEAFKAAALK